MPNAGYSIQLMRMLIKALIFGVSLLGFDQALAQRSAIDSLTVALRQAKADTNRVLLLAALSRQYIYSRPDSAILLAQEGYDLAQQLRFPAGESLCLNRMANPTQVLGNIPKALSLFKKAYQISEVSYDRAGMVRSLNNIANLHAEQGEYSKAIGYLNSAYAQNMYTKSAELQLIILENLGDCYRLANRLDSALFYTKRAYVISNRLQNFTLRGDIERILGDIEQQKADTRQALVYYRLSLASSAKVDDRQHRSQAYLSMATLFQTTRQPDSVIVYAQKALDQAEAGGFTRDIMKAASLLSDSYTVRKQPAEAFRYFKVSTVARDSLFSQEKVKQLLTLGFEERMKQQEIEAATKQYRDKIRIYSLLAGLLVLLFVSLLVLRAHQRQRKTNTLLLQQQAETEAALRALKAAQDHLIQSAKMASLGELTAGIAHEIQNPLNFVNNFSDVSIELIDELADERQKPRPDSVLEAELLVDLKENLRKINQHGRRASSIVHGMLAHSRRSAGNVRLTNINALVDEYVRLAYHGQKVKDPTFQCELVTQLDPATGQANVMPQELGQVLLNVLTNAFYALRDRQKQATSTYQPTLTVSTQRTSNAIQIRVSDNGTGIDEALQPKIFQPFFTTRRPGEGVGLGLSLSYDIITKGHGGSLTVASQPGQGSVFTIELPIEPDRTHRPN